MDDRLSGQTATKCNVQSTNESSWTMRLLDKVSPHDESLLGGGDDVMVVKGRSGLYKPEAGRTSCGVRLNERSLG